MLMLRIVRRLALAALLLTTVWAGAASATPITLSLDSIEIVGAAFPVEQTTTPTTPIGLGDIDFGLGTGWLKMLSYTTHINVTTNVPVIDADLDIQGWTQTISSIDGSGNITSSGIGQVTCTSYNFIGNFVCGAAPPTVAGWPPPDGASLTSSAVLDEGLMQIVVVDNSNASAGTVTSTYSYAIAPEPSTGMLTALGLVAFSVVSRRRKA
jgi:hypothetical protein